LFLGHYSLFSKNNDEDIIIVLYYAETLYVLYTSQSCNIIIRKCLFCLAYLLRKTILSGQYNDIITTVVRQTYIQTNGQYGLCLNDDERKTLVVGTQYYYKLQHMVNLILCYQMDNHKQQLKSKNRNESNADH